MSAAQPGEELGSDGRWFGDDSEPNGLFGNTAVRFGEPRGGVDATADLDHQQFHPFQEDGKRPSVAMETASTGDPMSGLFRKPMNDDGDVYTSLMSNQASYLPDDLKPSNALGDFTGDAYSFTSKTKTASNLPDDTPKSLLGSDKTESYNYMDISHGEERQGSRASADLDLVGRYIDNNPEGDEEDEEEENLGPALGSHSFPYVEDPSDEELNDYRSYRNLGGTPQTASPVKITLTGSSKAEPQQLPPSVGVSERENVLSVGQQGVPTVTLSEPEDDSPASTPNASPTRKQFSSDDMFKVESGKPAASRNNAGPKPRSRDHEGSSAESGDSEIELVSEEPPKPRSNPFTEAPKNKATSNPFDNAPVAKAGPGLAAGPAAYSILREEREAELDSDLIIESASEESPKREQGIGGPKQGAPSPSPLVYAASPPSSHPEVAPVQPPAAEKAKSPVRAEEDPPSKPKPPTATVPPEVRSEKPQPGDMPPQQDKGELGKAAVAALLQGFSKQKAIDLLYWRNVKQSGAVFSSVLLLLFSLTQFSVVSVGAYLALAALSASISFRIYKSVLQAVQKTDEGHPFKAYLEMEIALSQDQISKYADKILLYSNTCMKELRRLFLVQDLVDSLKFAVLMWLLTYVGALFNGLTLLILAVVSMFTLPVVYEKHQAQIDQYVGLIRTQVNSVVGKIQAKIPGAKRKEE
ncbi:reticulon-1a isoform X1 [Xiphophorus couchianus]|nr:reticulon-1 isoform X1 [Xiphophorus couchianus]